MTAIYLTAEERARVRQAIDVALIDKGDQSAVELAAKFDPVPDPPYWRTLDEATQKTLMEIHSEEVRDDISGFTEEYLDGFTKEEVDETLRVYREGDTT